MGARIRLWPIQLWRNWKPNYTTRPAESYRCQKKIYWTWKYLGWKLGESILETQANACTLKEDNASLKMRNEKEVSEVVSINKLINYINQLKQSGWDLNNDKMVDALYINMNFKQFLERNYWKIPRILRATTKN